MKARQSAQAGSVLRLLLSKYGIDLDKVVVCLAGTSEVLQHSASINRADRRKLIVMSQQEFQGNQCLYRIIKKCIDWLQSPHTDAPINAPSSPSPTADTIAGIPFHPIGDICVAELPIDIEHRSKPSAVRSLSSHAKVNEYIIYLINRMFFVGRSNVRYRWNA